MSAPPGHWMFGHIPAIRRDPLGLLDACTGPVARLNLGRSAWVLLDPRDILYVLEKSDSTFGKGRAFQFGRKLYGNSLLVSEGAEHQHQVRTIGGVFFRHSASHFLDPAPAITDRWASRWQPNQRINLWSVMVELTLAISSQAIFGNDWLPSWMGAKGHGEGDALLQAFDTAMDHVAQQNFSLLPLPDWVPTPTNRRYRQAIARLNRAFSESLERRQQGEATGGFLEELLNYHDEKGQPLPVNQLRDQTLIFLLGGYESTATSLCWTLLLLASHESVLQDVLQEIHANVEQPLPTKDDVRSLPLVSRVISESLRLYPPPWLIPRVALQNVELPSGFKVPTGAPLFLSPYRTQRDRQYFHEPSRFDPDRFAEPRSTDWPEGAYFPFGTGPRHCIGEGIARTQMVLILATLLRRWRLDLGGEGLPYPKPLLTLRPPNSMWVRVGSGNQ